MLSLHNPDYFISKVLYFNSDENVLKINSIHLKKLSIVHLELFDLAFLDVDWGTTVPDLK